MKMKGLWKQKAKDHIYILDTANETRLACQLCLNLLEDER